MSDTKFVRITDPELYEQLSELAKADNRSLTQYVNLLLSDAVLNKMAQ